MKRSKQLEQAMLEFRVATYHAIPIHFQNIEILIAHFRDMPGNPVLAYLLPEAVDNVLNTLVLETEQAWRMLNSLLRKMGRQELSDDDHVYRDLKRIRNKVVAHKVEVAVSSSKHLDWFKAKYKVFSEARGLIEQIALRISSRVDELEEDGLIGGTAYAAIPPRLSHRYVQDFIHLLRQHRML